LLFYRCSCAVIALFRRCYLAVISRFSNAELWANVHLSKVLIDIHPVAALARNSGA